ncbi:MAG: acyltransferase [Rhodobacter sp.]|nr:acyltransferase [Rhodobacter sp.]
MANDVRRGTAEERLHYVGWLRVMLIALVVGHHAAEPYNAAGGEWRAMLDDPVRSDLLLYFFLLNRTFFMGFFFFIAGYFVAASYDRRGPWAFARSRLLRLGVPLIVVVTFGFGTIGYGIYGEGSGYLRWLWFEYLTDGDAEYGPLWFTAHLLVYTLTYIGLRAASGGRPLAPELAPPGHLGVLGFALALGAATAALRPVFPIDEWVRLPGNVPAEPGRVPQYLGLFIVGIVAGRGDWLRWFDGRVAAVWFGIGMLALAAGLVALPQEALWGRHPLNVVWGFLEGFIGVGIILGLLALFRRAANVPGRWLRRLEAQVYGVYLIHIFIVIGLQMALVQAAWPALAKFGAVTAGALLLSFALVAVLRLIPPVRAVI